VSWMDAYVTPIFSRTLHPDLPTTPAAAPTASPAWKYVTKSTFASRSLLSVNDDIPTLKLPPDNRRHDSLERPSPGNRV